MLAGVAEPPAEEVQGESKHAYLASCGARMMCALYPSGACLGCMRTPCRNACIRSMPRRSLDARLRKVLDTHVKRAFDLRLRFASEQELRHRNCLFQLLQSMDLTWRMHYDWGMTIIINTNRSRDASLI